LKTLQNVWTHTMRELFLRFMYRCRLSCDKKKWRIGVVNGKNIVIFKLETWCLIRSFHINIEGNILHI